MAKAHKVKKLDNNVVNAILYIVIGILFIIFRAGMINILLTVVGVLFIVYSVFDFIRLRWFPAIVELAIGIIVLLGGWLFVQIALIVFGVLLAVWGISMLVPALKVGGFFGVLVAILAIAAGVLLVLAGVGHGAGWTFIDWIYIATGVLFVVDGVFALCNKKK